jgi:hypothetical protein
VERRGLRLRVGFSRGAFTARSTAGFVRNAGILKPQFQDRVAEAYALYRDRAKHPRGIEAQLFRRTYSYETRIRCIGVWDTVGALGIPLTGLPVVDAVNKHWHLWRQQPDAGDQRLEQVWFAGVHSDVGGGYPEGELADVALLWLVSRATECGLAPRPDAFPASQPPDAREEVVPVRPDPLGTMHGSRTGAHLLQSALHRPIGRKDPDHEQVAPAARQRWDGDASYRPEELAAYLEAHRETIAVPTPRAPEAPATPVSAAPEGPVPGTP